MGINAEYMGSVLKALFSVTLTATVQISALRAFISDCHL